jgi:hypothetical protein
MIGSDPYNQQRFQNWLSQIDRLRTMTMAEQPSVFESPDDAAPNHFGAALDAATKTRTTRAVADDVEPSVLVGDPGQPYNSPNVPGATPLPSDFNGTPSPTPSPSPSPSPISDTGVFTPTSPNGPRAGSPLTVYGGNPWSGLLTVDANGNVVSGGSPGPQGSIFGIDPRTRAAVLNANGVPSGPNSSPTFFGARSYFTQTPTAQGREGGGGGAAAGADDGAALSKLFGFGKHV